MPPRMLRVGVTGHRPDRLAGTDLAALGRGANQVLAAIADAAAGPVRLVSALAEGADSIIADAALAHGWALDVVLPFVRADYATDFEAGSAHDAHAARLAQAHAVFELPGDRAEEGAAYERAGRIMLAQCDVLVAVWDGGPIRGRGGAPQIVAEAVLQGIPVVQIDPARPDAPLLLWDGLTEIDLGQQTVETVPRGDLAGLHAVVRGLVDPPDNAGDRAMLARFGRMPVRRWAAGLAYPMLLMAMGIRRMRWTDMRAPLGGGANLLTGDGPFAARVRAILVSRFAHADAEATRAAQLFRSGYVANFALAAIAVILSLLGLALPSSAKPFLIALELGAIATILVTTRIGNHAAWHRRWLDNRSLAERLRCLAISAQMGELDLRGDIGEEPGWVGWHARATGRELGLPSVRVDDVYLAGVRSDLTALIDGQIAYLKTDAGRMHRLEHRLHLLGTILFAATAVTCLGLLVFKAFHEVAPSLDSLQHRMTIATTIVSAALPAIGAAIYGIRMQGDFAGIAERNEVLMHHLASLRHTIEGDHLSFDVLSRRVRRMTDLLTGDLEKWLQTYHARPLALPG